MRLKFFYSLALVATLMFSYAQAQQTAKVTPAGTWYLEYLPAGYSSNSNKYPVVISLHGVGEKGSTEADVIRVANVSLARYVKNGQQYPFIVISPQLKKSMSMWTGDYVMEVLNYAKTKLRIDPSRIYLTGLSLGGFGVWKTIAAYPAVFAAIAPICSGGNTVNSACKIAAEDVPVWAFHGDKDTRVSYNVSMRMINALNACSPKPSPLAKLTLFPGMGHGIWDKAYKETNVLDWLLSFKKGSVSSPPPPTTTPDNQLPVVSAGDDKAIILPTNSVSIQGNASDTDGSITSYQWSKTSGGTASLSGATGSRLTASNLTTGTYMFRLTVKDNKGASKYDDVKVTLNAAPVTSNKLPPVSAGNDQVLTLPRNGITIVGRVSDPDGTIKSYQWTKISGGGAPMANANTLKLWVYNLQAGTYVFRLTIKDDKGASKYDDVKLTVNAAPSASNKLPTVSAGNDQVLTLPRNGITIVGRASDSDGSIASYQWTKISGGAAPMSNLNTIKLWAYDLKAGTYVFRLTVKDDKGGTKYDDMKLTVKEGTVALSSEGTAIETEVAAVPSTR